MHVVVCVCCILWGTFVCICGVCVCWALCGPSPSGNSCPARVASLKITSPTFSLFFNFENLLIKCWTSWLVL